MKKLLILSTLISSIALAKTNTEAIMNIQAQVIKPLTVTASNINFGKIVAGTEATSQKGTFSIEGEKNETYIAYLSGTDKGKINLKYGENKLPVKIETTLSTNNLEKTLGSLDNNGKATETITAIAKTTTETVSGNYEGSLTLVVRYQ